MKTCNLKHKNVLHICAPYSHVYQKSKGDGRTCPFSIYVQLRWLIDYMQALALFDNKHDGSYADAHTCAGYLHEDIETLYILVMSCRKVCLSDDQTSDDYRNVIWLPISFITMTEQANATQSIYMCSILTTAVPQFRCSCKDIKILKFHFASRVHSFFLVIVALSYCHVNGLHMTFRFVLTCTCCLKFLYRCHFSSQILRFLLLNPYI